MRTQEQWLKEFDEMLHQCKWFIERFEGSYELLINLRKELKINQIINHLNNIWFELPDSFNIMNDNVMERGWREFLALIEFDNNEEVKQIING
jgi:hypothetical protein